MKRQPSYEEFLRSKVVTAPIRGFEVPKAKIHSWLKPHAKDIVRWALRQGNAAIFAAFGLHKTSMQLEIGRQVLQREGGRFLVVAPLGVRQEFKRDAVKLGLKIKYIRRIEECGKTGLYITNYETIREGKLDPRLFTGVSLDEASVLRGFGGTKTFREFMRLFENGQVKYKFVATATPDPNEYLELLAYAAFLDVMDVGQGKTRFFKRDSTKADKLTLHEHKEREFWLWVSTWAVFLQKPSDLGYSDEGYELPGMDIHWHEIKTDHFQAGFETSGQGRLTKETALGMVGAAAEKQNSLHPRLAKLMELRKLDPHASRLLWHDLEPEREALEKAIPSLVTVYGQQDLGEREKAIIDFSEGRFQELGTKPKLAGSGCNFQYHCSWAIFMGIGFKFNDFIQAIHRIYRFLQKKKVRIDLIYTEAERGVRQTLEDKWERYKLQVARMSEIIREYGLASNVLRGELQRVLFDPKERQEACGRDFLCVNNDAVYETRNMQEGSIHLILTSIPFSTQYEYSPIYNDLGHSDSNTHFFRQMDYLTPELFRVLQPGRICAVHVKDRITPGGITGLGFQTVYPFHADCIYHYQRYGFAFLGMKTIVTDVVRENKQTNRLGWTEQCKDGSRMGVGMSEYLLLFRKPQTDRTRGYADFPVVKEKAQYSRSRWQVDAHGFSRSSGNRLLTAEDLRGVDHPKMFQLFRQYSLENVYDFEHHVKLGESLELCGYCNHIHLGLADDDEGKVCGQKIRDGVCKCTHYKSLLPKTFMLLQPQSWSPDVWSDVTRMRTMNTLQAQKGQEPHLCPLQFDIVDRAITQYTMPREVVYDPFGGLMTVPYCAVKLGRFGIGCELNQRYWQDGANYCRAAEAQAAVPTLFDLVVEEPESAIGSRA